MIENTKIASLNVNGIRDKVKRLSIFGYLKSIDADLYFLQETHSTEKTNLKWQLEWENGNIIFNNGSSNANGVCILIKDTENLKIVKTYLNKNGRFIILDIGWDKEIVTVVNIYMPTKNKEQEQIETLLELQEYLTEFTCCHIILGGDLNLYLNKNLDSLTCSTQNDNYNFRDNWLAWMESLNLVDVWRIYNPSKKEYTWRRNQSYSRLDYILCSEHLLNKEFNTKIIPAKLSDHKLLLIELANLTENERGRGFWKFNANHLHDPEYVKLITNTINEFKKEYCYLPNKNLKWELLKFKIKVNSIEHSIKVKRERNKIESELLQRQKEIENVIQVNSDKDNNNLLEELNLIEAELDNIHKLRTKGAILRSKIKWAEEGEKSTSYFLNLEKTQQCNKVITQLIVENNVISDTEDILNEEKKFYQTLYTETKNVAQEDINKFTSLLNIERVKEEDKIICDAEFTKYEMLNSLKQLQNGKTPGTDGLTPDFYKFFWKDISDTLLESIKYSCKNGELSTEQKRGVITLIPKKGKDRKLLKNWRPISLLNTDYKLITKMLANRIKKVLPYLINEDQTGYIKGRYIGYNIRKMEDCIQFLNVKKLPGILLSIDFEKAFDSLNWNYILSVLKELNFGDTFISYIKMIYNNIEATVINNGRTCNWFKLERGVRQGCPVSPYLFIISVEILANKIRQDENINGININDSIIKISMLADDTVCYVSDLTSVKNALTTFDSFEKISGLKLNRDKTTAKYLGSLKDQ